jgi:hypothetical protein
MTLRTEHVLEWLDKLSLPIPEKHTRIILNSWNSAGSYRQLNVSELGHIHSIF